MKVAPTEVSSLSTNFSAAGLSLELKSVSHTSRAHVHYYVDGCLRLVYQPAGHSSRNRHLIGMSVGSCSRILRELGDLPFLTRTFQAASKAQNFVLTADSNRSPIFICSSNFKQQCSIINISTILVSEDCARRDAG